MGLPVIDIIFIQKAVTAIKRSKRGVAVIILKDDTAQAAQARTFKYEADITSKLYSAENFEILKRCFFVDVNKLIVVSVPTSTAEFADVKAILDKIKYNWACTTIEEFQDELASYTKSRNKESKGKKYKCVVCNVVVADDMHIVNIKPKSVTLKTSDGTAGEVVKMTDYVPRIVSLLANLPLNRSCTYYELEDLYRADDSYITDEKTADDWIDEGYLIFINDDDDAVKIGRGVNTLTTYTSTETKDMSSIIIVESMDLILEDIYQTFKNYYIGKYKNRLDNQYLFISAVNSYFRTLTTIQAGEVLDEEYDNVATIDIEAQREAWRSIGKEEAADWDDEDVKKMTFKTYMFLTANVKILNALEDLKFPIVMA